MTDGVNPEIAAQRAKFAKGDFTDHPAFIAQQQRAADGDTDAIASDRMRESIEARREQEERRKRDGKG